MDISEESGSKSRFYLMSGGVTKYDNRYLIDEPKCISLIRKINQRGHMIGLHSSYNTYNDSSQFNKEKDILEKILGRGIVEGRGHYLRFEIPVTWQIWEDNNMKVDSTCGYADKEGFRCGTGEEFTVFNILTRKKLNLKERPLLLMDGNLYSYQSIKLSKKKEVVNNIINNTKIFTLLWHNTQMVNVEFYNYIIQQAIKKSNSSIF